MNDEEFDQVSQIIFNGVNSIRKFGSPGILIPLTNDTRALLCGEASSNVIFVAARYGQGRCLIFSHSNYLKLFTNTEEYKDHLTFINNCKQWVSQGQTNEIFDINEEKTLKNAAEQGKILVWNGYNAKDDAFFDDLFSYFNSGGALICAATPWGWLQIKKQKDFTNYYFGRFCSTLGVAVTKSIAGTSDPISFRPNLLKYKNIYASIERLENEPMNGDLISVVGMAIAELNDVLPGISMNKLEDIVINGGKDVIPSKRNPIKDPQSRERSKAICGILSVLTEMKAPGVSDFPGDFDQPPNFETNISCSFESTVNEWYCTGYYVAPGTPVQIDIEEIQGATDWLVRIGCHSDDLKNCKELRRWNSISLCKPLTGKSLTVSSPFGGLLFLESPSEGLSSITVTIHNVVLSLTYNLMDPDRAESWEFKKENAQGLWADISGQYIVFNVPPASVQDLDSAVLDKILRFWDDSILAHHELLGTAPTLRERVVCDEQILAGYMHCGYPIATHLDICDPTAKNFPFNIDILEKEGAWGLYHELGHNRQRSWWTFDGTKEVTVNIFTLHAVYKMCNVEPWIHPWLDGHLSSASLYIKNGSNFVEWKDKPGVALFIYAQLAREYGWDNYKAVFRHYEETKPSLSSDQDKIDYWIITFSQQVGHNLVPLFKFWGFPVSQSTIDKLADLEIPPIKDILIDLAPERYSLSA